MSLTAKTLLAVALVSAALFLTGLGGAPFVDPPEGFHAVIARDMQRLGDWITPHINGVRYFDKPPLFYWLMSAAFAVFGPGEAAAQLGSAPPAVGVAVVTAWIGTRLAGPRVGLVAGLVVAANLELYLFARGEARPSVPLDASVIRGLPPGSVHLLQEGGGRWLYSNRP